MIEEAAVFVPPAEHLCVMEEDSRGRTTSTEEVVDLIRRLKKKLHLVVTIASDHDRTAVVRCIVDGDVHCMLSEITTVLQAHSARLSGSRVTDMALHNTHSIIKRLYQQVEEAFEVATKQDSRWFASLGFRSVRVNTREMMSTIDIIRYRFTRLITLIPALDRSPPLEYSSEDSDDSERPCNGMEEISITD